MTTYISGPNSSTVALATGTNFSGNWEDTLGFTDVIISVATDQNGYWTIEFSPDGANIDSTLTRYYRTSIINAPHRFTITRRYFRVRFYNNSGSAQTYLRLQTTVGTAVQPLNIPTDGTMARSYDAISTRPSHISHEIALGRRQGHRQFNKFGYNLDVDDASGEEVIAAFGGTYTVLTTASTLDIISSDATDDGDPAGDGANNVYVFGIDSNYDYVTETVTLNGTTSVQTATSWFGVNRMVVGLAGATKANAGTITATATTGGSTQAQIPASAGTTQQCIYHTAGDAKALMESIQLNINKLSGSSPKVVVKGYTFSRVSNCQYELFRLTIDTAVENTVLVVFPAPFVLNEKETFWLIADTNTDNTLVTARFDVVEYDDADA